MRSRNFFTLLFLLTALAGYAQPAYLSDQATGRPYLEMSGDKFQGSPLLFTNWQKATAVDKDGIVYKDMLVNINTVEHAPLFRTDKGVFYFKQFITEIQIEDGTQTKYKLSALVHKELPQGFVKVLSNEPLVVKLEKKELREIQEYNVAGKITEFKDAPEYYLIDKTGVNKFKLNDRGAQKVFAAKWNKVSDYADKNELSFKDEMTWIRLLSQYAALK